MIKKILNEMNTVKKIFLCLIIIFVIFVIIMVVINIFNTNNSNKDNDGNTHVAQKVDQMENYEYYLDDSATNYYKELYNDLKVVLNNNEVNDEEYAKVIAKLFVTDLFTLDNKLTSSDIGGLQYVYTDFKENFINIAKNTLYSSVESNIYGDRNQELPVVSDVQINSLETSSFAYQNNSYDSYNISLNISYEKDLGYPSLYSLVLIKNDKYFQVVAAE